MGKKTGRKWVCLLCAATLLLCACQSAQSVPGPLPLSTALPSAAGAAYVTYTAQLFFVSEDGRTLSIEERSLRVESTRSRGEGAIVALLSGPNNKALQPVVQEGLYFQRLEVSTDTCNVYLGGNVQLDGRMWLITRAACAATLYAAEGAGYVNLYYNNMEPGYMGRPLGVQAPITESLEAFVKNVQQEYTALAEENAEMGSYESHDLTVYYEDAAGKLLTTHTENVSYDRETLMEGVIQILLDKLRRPEAGGGASALPAGFTLAQAPTFYQIHPALEEEPAPDVQAAQAAPSLGSVMELVMEEPQAEYDAALMSGALTLTITGYLPEIAGVRILRRNEAGEDVNLLEGDAYYTRDMFTTQIGYTVYLAYPDGEGAFFYKVPHAVACAEAYSPIARMEALFAGPADPGIAIPLFTAEDIQRLYVDGDTAIVDWKAGFAQKLAALPGVADCSIARDKRVWLFIYSVVDTLTELSDIERVWMLEDGEKLGDVEGIYLGNALMRNPGMYTS